MIQPFIKSVVTYFRALGFITSRGLWKYFVWSGIIGLGIFVVLGYIMKTWISPFISSTVGGWLPWDFEWIFTATEWLTFAIGGILFLSIFKYLMIIATAPLMSVLSERVEREITGQDIKRSFIMNVVPDLLRSVRIVIRSLFRELFFTALILLLGLFPLFSLISGVLIFLVQGYYAGFGNFDYWAERHFTYRETIRELKTRKGLLTGNGLIYVLLLAIPIAGAFLAPPLSTVAATMNAVDAWPDAPDR